MTDFLNKISSYNIFNYLLPGVAFAVAGDALTKYDLIQSNNIVGLFVYYIIGLVISRIGSLALEPILRLTGFVKFAPYADFISASRKDQKLELLSEVNNTYRTLCVAIFLVGMLRFYQFVEELVPIVGRFTGPGLFVLLLAIFLFSYRKQTGFIVKRVESTKENK